MSALYHQVLGDTIRIAAGIRNADPNVGGDINHCTCRRVLGSLDSGRLGAVVINHGQDIHSVVRHLIDATLQRFRERSVTPVISHVDDRRRRITHHNHLPHGSIVAATVNRLVETLYVVAVIVSRIRVRTTLVRFCERNLHLLTTVVFRYNLNWGEDGILASEKGILQDAGERRCDGILHGHHIHACIFPTPDIVHHVCSIDRHHAGISLETIRSGVGILQQLRLRGEPSTCILDIRIGFVWFRHLIQASVNRSVQTFRTMQRILQGIDDLNDLRTSG